MIKQYKQMNSTQSIMEHVSCLLLMLVYQKCTHENFKNIGNIKTSKCDSRRMRKMQNVENAKMQSGNNLKQRYLMQYIYGMGAT